MIVKAFLRRLLLTVVPIYVIILIKEKGVRFLNQVVTYCPRWLK